jgi:predicted nucleic acid-binding protein
MNGADNQIFIDTNILVCASVTKSPYHQIALKVLTELYNTGSEIWISRQFIREYLATLTRPQKFSQKIAISTLSKHIQYFETIFNIAEDSAQITITYPEYLHRIQVNIGKIRCLHPSHQVK